MKISICIPQYNRISYLLKNLRLIEKQSYKNIEVVVSDDCSSDNTKEAIEALVPQYKYPLIYKRNVKNLGYDNNFRQSIELSSGEYVIIIGNDDSINPAYDINNLVQFLEKNEKPDLGFANFIEEANNNFLVERAKETGLLGSGPEMAMNYYSCFSFVGGLIYKKTAFLKYNTSKHDGSIYAQIYLAAVMISCGCTLFSIKEPLVVKDLVIEQDVRNSYKDVIARTWKDYKVEMGGLPSVINVLIDAFQDANVLTQSLIYKIHKRIYTKTFPFWIVDYKSNGALPAAVGLISGLRPTRHNNFYKLNFLNKIKIYIFYCLSSITGLLMPVALFSKIKQWLYGRNKK